MGVVQGVRKAKRLRTEAQLLSAKEVLCPDEFKSSDKALARSNAEFGATERWNYTVACMQAHEGVQELVHNVRCDRGGPHEVLGGRHLQLGRKGRILWSSSGTHIISVDMLGSNQFCHSKTVQNALRKRCKLDSVVSITFLFMVPNLLCI